MLTAESHTSPTASPRPPVPAVAAHALVVDRGRRRVLHGLTFSVATGSVTGLLGPSGCGKTTLLRSIVGVQRTVSGTVTVLGQPAGAAVLRRQIGYVTQAPSIYGDLSVRDNARYFAALQGARSGAADAALRDVGLTDRADALVRDLSGGQRARASLACALIGPPALLVLDEPTVGLDPVLRRDLWDLFHHLAAAGTTLLVSSHVMDEANRCGRLLLMRDGRLIADDSPAAIRAETGAQDLEEAFLTLVERADGSGGKGPA